LHAAPDLENLIALEVGGARLSTSSATGADALTGRPSVAEYAGRVGATSAVDVTVASAVDPNGNVGLTILAVRVVGAGGHDPVAAFVAVIAAAGEDWSTESLNGRNVAHGEAGQYAYASGDVLFVLAASDDVLAQEALGKLP